MVIAAAVYCRISDDRDGSAAGVRRQQDDCEDLAERRGWPVAEVYIDNDVSAYGSKRRPAYRRMLEDLKAGTRDAVVVWHLDRLHRQPKELEEFFEICDAAGVKDLASVTGDVDLSTADGRFMARILGAVARKESDDKGRRTRRKHLELAQAGLPVGSGRPFGYDDDRVTIRENEAALVRSAAARILAGESVRSIAADWKAAGVVSTKGNTISQSLLRRILLGARIAGLRTLGFDGPVVATAVWPAIIDEVTWRRLRAVLLDPARRTAGFTARRYLLTGFLFCGKCGVRLIAQPRTNRRRSYTCPLGPDKGGCGGIRIVAEPLEEMLVAGVIARVDGAVVAELASGKGFDDEEHRLLDALAAAEHDLGQLSRDYYAEKIIGKVQFLAASEALTAKVDQLRRQLGALSRDRSVLDVAGEGLLASRWEAMNLDQRRAVVAAFVERITITPARHSRGKFDRDRVDVSWRR